jgi:hypothetical protein
MPVQDAGRVIATIADAMSRALSVPSREIERIQPRWWQSASWRVQALLRHRLPRMPRLPSDGGLRIVRDEGESA